MVAAWGLSGIFSIPIIFLYEEKIVQVGIVLNYRNEIIKLRVFFLNYYYCDCIEYLINIVSIAFVLFCFVLFYKGKKQCWIDLGSPLKWRIYMSLVSFTLFLAPTVIISGCYMVIVATIWSQSNALRQGPMRDRRASSRGLIPRAKIKTVKMTFVIVFGKLF